MPRNEAVAKHNRSILHEVLKMGSEKLAVIADGTYIYVEQPSDQTQRLLYSARKGRNLIKSMMLVLPSSYIPKVEGPYRANGGNNDATIMQQIVLETPLKNYLDANDLNVNECWW